MVTVTQFIVITRPSRRKEWLVNVHERKEGFRPSIDGVNWPVDEVRHLDTARVCKSLADAEAGAKQVASWRGITEIQLGYQYA